MLDRIQKSYHELGVVRNSVPKELAVLLQEAPNVGIMPIIIFTLLYLLRCCESSLNLHFQKQGTYFKIVLQDSYSHLAQIPVYVWVVFHCFELFFWMWIMKWHCENLLRISYQMVQTPNSCILCTVTKFGCILVPHCFPESSCSVSIIPFIMSYKHINSTRGLPAFLVPSIFLSLTQFSINICWIIESSNRIKSQQRVGSVNKKK